MLHRNSEGVPRILLPSGLRWVVLVLGERAHVLDVEHHWQEGGVFDWEAPMSPYTKCGVSTENHYFNVTSMSAYEQEACVECWKLIGGTSSE